ncbi:Dynein_heavy chain [Hexamita inflata]|uniref:Dynein heavy chain n=1 Tax=Hexamita inflata TaxID=28002 RepID=A0AA86TZW5_9EUKA|nr:Dynein heavy chain [Hexamita inflata]
MQRNLLQNQKPRTQSQNRVPSQFQAKPILIQEPLMELPPTTILPTLNRSQKSQSQTSQNEYYNRPQTRAESVTERQLTKSEQTAQEVAERLSQIRTSTSLSYVGKSLDSKFKSQLKPPQKQVSLLQRPSTQALQTRSGQTRAEDIINIFKTMSQQGNSQNIDFITQIQLKETVEQLNKNQFVYLTFDTPEIRLGLQNNAPNSYFQNLYKQSNPSFNFYELVTCNFDQVNSKYFATLSKNGFQLTYYDECVMCEISEWERQKQLFLRMKQTKFAKKFVLLKSMIIWRNTVKNSAKMSAKSLLYNKSLYSDSIYVNTIVKTLQNLCFSPDLFGAKLFTWLEYSNFTRLKFGSGALKSLRHTYTDQVQPSFNIEQFQNAFTQQLNQFKSALTESSIVISNQLFESCKFVGQNILNRIEMQKTQNKMKTADQIIEMTANSRIFNDVNIKALVRVIDNIFIQQLIQTVHEQLQQLSQILFGVQEVETKYYTTVDENTDKFEVNEPQITQHDEALKFTANIDLKRLITDNTANTTTPMNLDRNTVKQRDPVQLEIDDIFELDAKNLQVLTKTDRIAIQKFKLNFTDEPLVQINGFYPPTPTINVKFIAEFQGVAPQPSAQQMVDLIDKIYTDLVCCVNKITRPYDNKNLIDLLESIIKSKALLYQNTVQFAEYIDDVRDINVVIIQIKRNIRYSFIKIAEYQTGLNTTLNNFALVLSTFSYTEKYKCKVDLNEILLSLFNTTQQIEVNDPAQYSLYQLQQLQNNRPEQFIQLYKQILFPKLSLREEFTSNLEIIICC